jgi:hypothetical protein
MVMEICKKLGLEKNTELVTRANTSVRYWVAHKSWRLRDHFKILGTPSYAVECVRVEEVLILLGNRYKTTHKHDDWSNALPPLSVVKALTNQKEVDEWLFQSLGMRLALRKMMSNPDIRRALWIVFVAGLRYSDPSSQPTHCPHLLLLVA